MTVGELIEQLRTFAPGLMVLRGDNSGGYEATYPPRYEEDVAEIGCDATKRHLTPAVIIG